MNNKKNIIGVLGYWAGLNYGSELTNFATYKFLKERGYSVKMYDISLEEKCYKSPPLFYENPYEDEVLNGRYKNKKDLKTINKECSTFITTSDQQLHHWVYKISGETAALDFITKNKKIIAYAASYGHDDFYGTEEVRATISHFLKEIDFFSVREKSAVNLSKEKFGINATWVVDPVFICNSNTYNDLVKNSKINKKIDNYLFSYILDLNQDNTKFIKDLASTKNLKSVIVTDAQKKDKTKLEDWLAYIKNCNFYITDSFHGTCLGIILKKQFIVLINNRGKNRLESILGMLGLQNRIANSIEEAWSIINNEPPINYEKVEPILKKEILNSQEWLINAIESKIGYKSYTTFDILDARCDILENKINNLDAKKLHEIITELELLHLLSKKNKIFRNYYKHKILSKLLRGGGFSGYHKNEAKRLHQKVRRIRQLEKEGV